MAESSRSDFSLVNAAAAAAANHLLRGAAWARAELLPHAGKTVRFELFPAVFTLVVADGGTVAPAPAGAAADVALRATPGVLLRLAARDESAWTDVDASGDTGFATAINRLARDLRWDVEEDLSRVFGDIAAHRMAGSARALGHWARESADGVARSFAEYWTEERPLIAAARDVADFNRQVDDLRDAVARLEKRMGTARGAAPPDRAD